MVGQNADSGGEGAMLRLLGAAGKADRSKKLKNAAWNIYFTDHSH